MDKRTEHQPLDDFFQRRLKEASVSPGADTWNRLQNRMADRAIGEQQPTRRRIGLIWYGASAAAAACLFIAFLWKAQTDPTHEAHTQPQLATTTQKANSSLTTGKDVRKSVEQNKVIIGQANPQIAMSKSDLAVAKETELPAKTPVFQQEPDKISPSPQPTVQLAQAPKTPSSTENPGETTLATNANPLVKPAEATPKNDSKPERTLVVSVAEPIFTQSITTSENSAEGLKSNPANQTKNGRLSRLFKQIKRLKGEEVYARVDFGQQEPDEDRGVVDRLIHSTLAKDKEHKQQK